MERRTDMHISTLRQVVEAMGGQPGDHRALPGCRRAARPTRRRGVGRADRR
jgi:hypothetical protein